MKKIIFTAIVLVIIFTHCSKQADDVSYIQSPPPPPPIQHLIANAGADTTICMPYGGTGKLFKAILNGRASKADAGKIISYSWTEIVNEGSPFPQAQIIESYKDSTSVIFSAGSGLHQFNLQVRDDRGEVQNDQVSINVISPFNYAYDELSWDSTTGGLNTISIKFKPGVMESWPTGLFREVYFKNFQGCANINRWQKIPFVPYDSISLTDKPLFFSLVLGHSSLISSGILYTEIYCKSNSGIDISQKVSVGFTMFSPQNH